MAKWRWPSVALALSLGRCLFPSVADLSDGAPGDAVTQEAGDAGPDAPEGGCPPNGDPTLVLYYPFDEGSGTTIHDCSGNGNNGTLVGKGTWTTGHVGGAIAFSEANQTCVEANTSTLTQTLDFTAAAWVDLAVSYDAGTKYVVGRRQNGVLGWRIAEDVATTLSFQIGVPNDAGGYDQTADSTKVSLSTWHHVAGVFRAGTAQQIYIDGVMTGSTLAPAAVTPDPSTMVRVGCKGDDSSYLTGTVDEVRIYSRALSASEIATLAK